MPQGPSFYLAEYWRGWVRVGAVVGNGVVAGDRRRFAFFIHHTAQVNAKNTTHTKHIVHQTYHIHKTHNRAISMPVKTLHTQTNKPTQEHTKNRHTKHHIQENTYLEHNKSPAEYADELHAANSAP